MLSRRRFVASAGAAAGLLALPARAAARGATQWLPAPDHAALAMRWRHPYNGEPCLAALLESPVTPTEHLYVLSHGNTPAIAADRYRLVVDGLVHRPLVLSLSELVNDFTPHTVIATLACAGLRRREHSAKRPVEGAQWGPGAIGTPQWTGTPIAALLARAGIAAGARHVHLHGLDTIEAGGSRTDYAGSIPLSRALEPSTAPALVAYELNGVALTPRHGFPARAVVPGFIGARSVKWLGRITVSAAPSNHHYMTRAYRLVTRPSELENAASLQRLPLNAALRVMSPVDADGMIEVRGWSLAPGERGVTVAAVEVTTDSRHWHRAELLTPAIEYRWRLWRARVPVAAGATQVAVRAIDSRGRKQPRDVPWNLWGYVFNGWHYRPITRG